MFQPINPDDFAETYKSLPTDLQDALVSDLTTEKIRTIALRSLLEKEKNSRLADLVAYTLMGKLSPKDFIKTLREELNIDSKSASDIAQDVNREIFFPVREDLKELYGITEQGLGAGVEGLATEKVTETRPTSQPSPSKILEDKTWEGKQPAQGPGARGQGEGPSSITEAIEERKGPPSNLPTSPSQVSPSKTWEGKPLPKEGSSEDKYKEPIESEDTQNLPPPTPKPSSVKTSEGETRSGPKIEGNVIDLKGIDVE